MNRLIRINTLIAVLFLGSLSPNLQVSAQVEGVTIGALIDQAKGAASDLIAHGQAAANDVILNAGNTLQATANGLAIAYESQLETTLESLEGVRERSFREFDEAIRDADVSIDNVGKIVNAAGSVVSSLPAAKRFPVVTDVEFPLISEGRRPGNITLSGFNLELWDVSIDSDSLQLEISTHISTRMVLRVLDVEENSEFWGLHQANILFKEKTALLNLLGGRKELEFTVSGISVDWSKLQARLTYRQTVSEKTYSDPIVRSKRQPRVDHRWAHRVDFIPVAPAKVDVDSFKASWWEHDECSNAQTFYTLESIDSVRGVRVLMQGKEQGGLWRDCGATLSYTIRTFVEKRSVTQKQTNWQDIALSTLFEYPEDNASFRSLQIKNKDSNEVVSEVTLSSPGALEFFKIDHEAAINTIRIVGK